MLDLNDGPVVLQVPPNVLGPVDDAYFRYIADVGLVGRDKGKGGKYLLVPPDYKGAVPQRGVFRHTSPHQQHADLLPRLRGGGRHSPQQ